MGWHLLSPFDGMQEADAMQYVAGYTVAHDVSARDWQLKKNGGQWLVGKVWLRGINSCLQALKHTTAFLVV